MPANLNLGATSAWAIETSPETAALILVWPDRETHDAAMEKIRNLKESGASEFEIEMTGLIKGDVRASI